MGEELVVPLRAQDDNLADDVSITGVNLPLNAVLSDVVRNISQRVPELWTGCGPSHPAELNHCFQVCPALCPRMTFAIMTLNETTCYSVYEQCNYLY